MRSRARLSPIVKLTKSTRTTLQNVSSGVIRSTMRTQPNITKCQNRNVIVKSNLAKFKKNALFLFYIFVIRLFSLLLQRDSHLLAQNYYFYFIKTKKSLKK